MTVEQSPTNATMERLATAFRVGSGVYASQGSPLYAALSLAGADDPEILDLTSHAMTGAPPVHLFTAVHFLLLSGIDHPLARFFPTLADVPAPAEQAWPDFRSFCLEHREELVRLLETRSVQMTYVERCCRLLPAICHVADLAGEPLNLIEIGCSAGVLLTFDSYAYKFNDGQIIGRGDAPFVLEGAFSGNPPLRIPRIGKRIGIDLNIIDAGSKDDRRWMLATCFPELREEQAHLTDAMDIVAGSDIRWLEGDGLVRLAEALADTPDPVCVYHSACLFYWPQEARIALHDKFRELSRNRTIYRIGIEPSSKFNQQMSGDTNLTDDEEKNTRTSGEITLVCYKNGEAQSSILALTGQSRFKWLE